MIARCRICHVETITDSAGRCRGCREAKLATDMGTSYGKFKHVMLERFGVIEDERADMTAKCGLCGKPFLPKTYNSKYCSAVCSTRAASRAYYKRKHKDAGHRAPVETLGGDHGANTADQIGGRAHENEPVTKSKKERRISKPAGEAPSDQ